MTVGTFRIYSGSTLADGTLTANSYALNGGTVNANLGSGSITVGGSTALNAASAASSVNITNGTLSLGAVNVLANANIVVTNAGTLNLGLYSNAVSSFTLNGGTLSGTGILTSTGGYILNGGTVNGYLGAGTISISTGTTVLTSSNQLSPSSIIDLSGSGTLSIGGMQQASSFVNMGGALVGTGPLVASSYFLNGGTIGVSLGTGSVTVGTGTTTFGSAGLLTSASSLSITNGELNLGGPETVSSLAMSGGVLTNGSVAATVATLSGGIVASPLTGPGSLVVTGGNVVLTSSNTYSGGTFINGGSLNAQSVGSGTLSLNGAGSAVSFVDGLTGAPMNLGGVTFATNSTIFLNDATSSLLSTGALTLSGSNNAISLSGTNWGSGTYTLISGSSVIGTNIVLMGSVVNGATIPLGSAVTFGRTVYSFSDVGNALTLVQSGQPLNLIWSGGQNNLWDTNSTNWQQTTNPGVNITMVSYDNVTLDNQATNSPINVVETGVTNGTISVTNSSGTVILNGGKITANSFTASGAGNLIVSNTLSLGAGSFVQNGSGTVELSDTNSYSGGTLVSSGVLVGNSFSLHGLITNNSSVVFNQIGSGTYSGLMSGIGSLTLSGAGTLILTAHNTYTGGTYLTDGHKRRATDKRSDYHQRRQS